MYKSGKNWMVAGLMTTAVLAGLTLSNTGNTIVAKADDNAPVAVNKDAAKDTQATPADKAKVDVDATSNKIASATKDVNDVKNNNTANKSVAPTTDPKGATSQASSILDNHKKANDVVKNANSILDQAKTDAKNANDVYAKAQDNVNKTGKALDEANNNQKAADKAYNDAVNDQDVKYFDAKNVAKADQDAANKAANKANESAKAAQTIKDTAQKAYDNAKAALDVAKKQYQRDISAYRHKKTRHKKIAVNNSKKALNAAKKAFAAADHNLNNMNNYDALKSTKKAEDAAKKALDDAKTAVIQDNSEWNQEAESLAEKDYDTATKNHSHAEKAFTNDNDTIASYVAAKDTADNDQDASKQAEAKATSSQNVADSIKKEASDAAQAVLDTMNNYDAYLAAKDNEAAKLDALQNAQNDEINDPSDWNEEVLAKAQQEYDNAQEATSAAKEKIADKLNLANSRDALKAAKEAAATAVSDATKANNDAINAAKNVHDVLVAANDNVTKAQKLVDDAKSAQSDSEALVEKANDLLKNIDFNQAKDDKKTTNDDVVTPKNDESSDQQKVTLDDTPVAQETKVANSTATPATTPATVSMTRAEYKDAQSNQERNNTTLPQTGNEDSAAVMALGAVSAMLGLGMVAKKREF